MFILGVVVGILIAIGGIFGILHIGDLNNRRQDAIDARIDKLHE